MTHRKGEFNSSDLDDMFGYLCFLLDIYTKRLHLSGIQTLDYVAQKDSSIDDYAMSNPLQRSAYDIKNWLFNKKDWTNSKNEATSQFISSNQSYRKQTFKNIVIKQIMEIFHFLMDLRQAYLMNNLVEHFHIDVFRNYDILNLQGGMSSQDIAIKRMIKDMKSVIINDDEVSLRIPYRFPSIDTMYEKNRKPFLNKLSKEERANMHDDFRMLLVDTFNTIFSNKALKQSTLTLLVRFHSEKTEFIRNIEKMVLVFNQEEWDFYKWANFTIDTFTRKIDKSALWLNEQDEFDDYKYIKNVLDCLNKLNNAFYYSYSISYDRNEEVYIIDFEEEEREVNEFVQKIYRNIKIYDHIISFITNNIKLLKLVRTSGQFSDESEHAKKGRDVKEIFRMCLKILEGMVNNNPENKEILWKYKEFFIFSDLESSPQDGELELVREIIDDNTQIISERSMATFVASLHKRIGHKSNFVILLEIYNKLINYESEDTVKSFLLKAISGKPEMLAGENQDDLEDYLAAVNSKEVLLNILFGGETSPSGATSAALNTALAYSIDTFISSFKLTDMLSKIEKSMEKFDFLYQTKDENMNIDYDDICEREQNVTVMLYSSMYLNKYSEHFSAIDLVRYFYQTLLPEYENKLDKLIEKSYDINTIKMSDAKLLTSNLPIVCKKTKFLINDLSNGDDFRYEQISEFTGLLENKFDQIDQKIAHLVRKLRDSENEDI